MSTMCVLVTVRSWQVKSFASGMKVQNLFFLQKCSEEVCVFHYFPIKICNRHHHLAEALVHFPFLHTIVSFSSFMGTLMMLLLLPLQ